MKMGIADTLVLPEGASLQNLEDTILTKLGYDPELERQKREAEKPATLLPFPAPPFAAPDQGIVVSTNREEA
jgi:hypothetical protein